MTIDDPDTAPPPPDAATRALQIILGGVVLFVIGWIAINTVHGHSEAKDAEERFAIVEKSAYATSQDKCDAAKAVAAAYLKERNAAQYDAWKVSAETYCLRAQLCAQGAC